MSNLNVEHIEFISASNKLKDCDIKDKEKYSDRKKLGIAKCLGILTNDFRFNEHIEYFNGNKKKDDLSGKLNYNYTIMWKIILFFIQYLVYII